MEFGARFNNNWEITNYYTEKKNNLYNFRGSKYLQSRINNSYLQAEKYLKSNRKVLFTGTPCQIKGFKLYLKKEYDKLYTVDFLCHGVPSPKVWNGYLSELEEHLNINAKKDIDNIIFRNKKNGWQSYSFSISYYNNLNIRKEFSELYYDNIFMKGFLNDLYLRP